MRPNRLRSPFSASRSVARTPRTQLASTAAVLYKHVLRVPAVRPPPSRSLFTTTNTTATTRPAKAPYSTSAMSSFYELKAELPNGQQYDFEQLKGKVVLIVNTASKW